MFLKELREFINNLLHWVWLWLGLSLVCFSFPSGRPFAAQLFERFHQDLLPAGVQLIVTDPLNGFVALVMVAVSMAFVLAFPFFIYKIARYLAPALFEQEKNVMLQVLTPSIILFFLGCVFAYYLLIPLTFRFLYPYAAAIGALPFFRVSDFIGLVFGMILVTGLLFLLPVGMMLLNTFGLVSREFWTRNWRYVFFAFLVVSAIITPDGTGLTMLMLCVPFMALYYLGAFMKVSIKGG